MKSTVSYGSWFFPLQFMTCMFCTWAVNWWGKTWSVTWLVRGIYDVARYSVVFREIWAFWLVLSWLWFRHTDQFYRNGHKLCLFFVFESQQIQNKHGCSATAVYNRLLTNLACSNRIGEYWPSVIFAWTSLLSVCTVTTSGQFIPQYGPHAQLVRG